MIEKTEEQILRTVEEKNWGGFSREVWMSSLGRARSEIGIILKCLGMQAQENCLAKMRVLDIGCGCDNTSGDGGHPPAFPILSAELGGLSFGMDIGRYYGPLSEVYRHIYEDITMITDLLTATEQSGFEIIHCDNLTTKIPSPMLCRIVGSNGINNVHEKILDMMTQAVVDGGIISFNGKIYRRSGNQINLLSSHN